MEAGSSLFDQYTSSTSRQRGRGVGTTRSAQLRANGIRITCYLNCDAAGSPTLGGERFHGTIVKLPEACDTISEVILKIQKGMKLDTRMLYAADLWTPDGTKITNFDILCDMAALDSPIIVGCGEPFDASRIPQDLLEFHREGGGRVGPRKVHRELTHRRKQALHDKAETVRASGHGINSEAVAVARGQAQELNREHVLDMRQRYMESLVQRSAQHADLLQSVKQSIEYQRMEQAESKARMEEAARERLEALNAERRRLKEVSAAARADELAKRRAMADKVRAKKSGEAAQRMTAAKRRAKTARAREPFSGVNRMQRGQVAWSPIPSKR